MNKENNARGIVLMVLSMGAFAIADTLIKFTTQTLSPAQVIFYLIGGAMIIFPIMAIARGDKLRDRRAFAPILLLRYICEVIGVIAMVLALAFVPLSTVGAITQATPMLAAVGAVLFLGEKVSWRRWSAISLGFIGVLLIVQPGTEGFDSSVFLAILAMAAMSVRDLTTRMTPPGMPSSSLATYTMVAAFPFAIGWVLLEGSSPFPVETNWLIVIPMTVLGAIGYMLLIASLRTAEVSIVMPFRYSRIIILLAFGILIFKERPNAMMLMGAALVIVSGIYFIWRERIVRQSGT